MEDAMFQGLRMPFRGRLPENLPGWRTKLFAMAFMVTLVFSATHVYASSCPTSQLFNSASCKSEGECLDLMSGAQPEYAPNSMSACYIVYCNGYGCPYAECFACNYSIAGDPPDLNPELPDPDPDPDTGPGPAGGPNNGPGESCPR